MAMDGFFETWSPRIRSVFRIVLGLLFIEQHVHHALALCDRATILDHGTVAWSGPAGEAEARVQTHLSAS